MTGKSGRGTARQTMRIPESEWEEFGDGCEAGGTDRTVYVLEAIRYALGRPGSKAPKRLPNANPAGVRAYIEGRTTGNPKGRTWYEFRTAVRIDNDMQAILDEAGGQISTDNNDRVFAPNREAVLKAYMKLREAGYLIVGAGDKEEQ